MSPTAAWLRAVLAASGSGHTNGNPPLWQCPAHDDVHPSLSVLDRPHGRASVKCFTHCTTDEVLAALKVTRRVLHHPPRLEPTEHARRYITVTYPPVDLTRPGAGRDGRTWKWEAAHPYGDRWRVVRYRATDGTKDLRWETRDDAGAWIPGLRGAAVRDLPLYLERQVAMGIAAGETIYLVESESSVDALAGRGLYATTWAGGASAPNLRRLRHLLTGAHVVLVPDNDPPGLACAQRIRDELADHAASLEVLTPPEGDDARDLLRDDPAAFGLTTRRTTTTKENPA
ncbi:MAG: toprim domain-containing protein [Candidatus Nanopelagicales bacterium]